MSRLQDGENRRTSPSHGSMVRHLWHVLDTLVYKLNVEHVACVQLCVLSTQSQGTLDVTDEMSQGRNTINGHCTRNKSAPVHKRDTKRQKIIKIAQHEIQEECSSYSSKLEERIENNQVDIERKVRGALELNARKRKRNQEVNQRRKRCRMSVQSTRQFLSCFVLGHPWMVVRHIHKSKKSV